MEARLKLTNFKNIQKEFGLKSKLFFYRRVQNIRKLRLNNLNKILIINILFKSS